MWQQVAKACNAHLRFQCHSYSELKDESMEAKSQGMVVITSSATVRCQEEFSKPQPQNDPSNPL